MKRKGNNMRLEEQVASLELCKRLRELGVKQESAFYWVREKTNENDEYSEVMFKRGKNFIPTDAKEYYASFNPLSCEYFSAFTVSELGEMLPGRIRLPEDDYWLWITKDKNGNFFECRFYNAKWGMPFSQVQEETEADARAKMLIHLIEKGLVKPEGEVKG